MSSTRRRGDGRRRVRVRAEAELERARTADPRIGLDEVRALLADLVREAPAP
ncbi:MAG TPA: hypothetical protein VNP92_03325 [Actinophytocola sp.]|nr:hypothetical protein [Actinophytocola sp.]